jgi:dihydrofolate synthase/folylpolyglutamate synthase
VAALAFDYFRRREVDISVIETGLGGRLDATNVLSPLLTLTTDISFDHVEILGGTLGKIAFEKAGIIKPGTPHLIGLLPPAAEKVIRRVCNEKKAPFFRLNKSDFRIFPERLRLYFSSDGLEINSLAPSLVGTHQLKNTALTLKALSILRDFYGLNISKKAIMKGLRHTDWPGRFQVFRGNGRPTLVLDVCHNAAGVKAFVESFRVLYPGRKAHVIAGFVKRKEHQSMFDELSRITGEINLVPMKTRRSMDLDELIKTINWRELRVKKYGSLNAAYIKVLKTAGPDDIINIIGSHYLVGEFLKNYIWK